MTDTSLSNDQQSAKQKLDTACSCGSGKKYGFCHGANENCYCEAGLLGKKAKECHYNPSEANATEMAAASESMTVTEPTVVSREDADDGGDFMVE